MECLSTYGQSDTIPAQDGIECTKTEKISNDHKADLLEEYQQIRNKTFPLDKQLSEGLLRPDDLICDKI